MKYVYLKSNLGEITKIEDSHVLNKMTFTHPIHKDGSETLYFKLLKKAYYGEFQLNNVNARTEFCTTYETCKSMLSELTYTGFIDMEFNWKYRLTELGNKYVDLVHTKGFKNFELKKGVYLAVDSILVSNDKDIKDEDTIELQGDEIIEFLEDNPTLEFRQVECIY